MSDAPHDLSPEEVRVLGCLVEKESTTPDNYPLTLNGLRSACNQSTSRDPVVSYDDHQIERALAALRERGLTRTVHSTSNRATKYRHVLPDELGLDAAATAVLAVLLLRGAQTVGELKTRTERQHRFDSPDEVADVLADLAARPDPLVRQLARQPGQKDARWVHLLAPRPDPVVVTTDERSTPDHPTVTASVRASATDPYGEATAEFYELLGTGMWDSLGLQLLELLEHVDPAAGPIVDVGAGTGIGIAHLRLAVPGATVFAIEPSRAMRTALHMRLAMDDELSRVTTVSPTSLADAELPDRAAAVFVGAAYGHLTDAEREKLWRFVAEVLPRGAPCVVGVLPPARATDVPLLRYGERRVGEHTYEGWQSAERVDDRSMNWTMVYKVLDGDRVVAEHTATAPWRCDGVDDIRREVASFGLDLDDHGDVVVVRRA